MTYILKLFPNQLLEIDLKRKISMIHCPSWQQMDIKDVRLNLGIDYYYFSRPMMLLNLFDLAVLSVEPHQQFYCGLMT
jgi:hypothetical protein